MVTQVVMRLAVGAALLAVMGMGPVYGQQDSFEIVPVDAEETNDGCVKVRLVIRGFSERGIPVLSNVPYVSRMFKNIGVGTTTRTFTIPLSGGSAPQDAPTAQRQQDSPFDETEAQFHAIEWQAPPALPQASQVQVPDAANQPILLPQVTDSYPEAPASPAPQFSTEPVAAPPVPVQGQSADVGPRPWQPRRPTLVTRIQASLDPTWQVACEPIPPCENPVTSRPSDEPCQQAQCAQCPVLQGVSDHWVRAQPLPAPVHHWHQGQHDRLAHLHAEVNRLQAREQFMQEYIEAREEWMSELLDTQVHAARLEAALEAAEAREEMMEGVMELLVDRAQLQAYVEFVTEQREANLAPVTSPPGVGCTPNCPQRENEELKERIAVLEKKLEELARSTASDAVRR